MRSFLRSYFLVFGSEIHIFLNTFHSFCISKSFEYFQLPLELISYHTSQKYLHKKIQLGTKERWKERRSFAREGERECVRFLASERSEFVAL